MRGAACKDGTWTTRQLEENEQIMWSMREVAKECSLVE
jgi:hypothetical protein